MTAATEVTSRAEIAEVLAEANREAKRKPCVVRKFKADPPTAWDEAHEFINALIEDWENAPA